MVIASKPMRYGKALSANLLSEVEWPENAVPEGSFTKISDLLKGNGKRVVLSHIARNEPVLRTKISGPGQRASLSAMLKPHTKAVTIRVNDVNGVGGFVLPGDRVDILLTRDETKTNDKDQTATFNHVLLQNIHVLAVDQMADDRQDKPLIAKTVTVEVDMTSAQKLALASSVGNLSLLLRQAGSGHHQNIQKISVSDLMKSELINDREHDKNEHIAKIESNRNNEEVKQILTAGRAKAQEVKVKVVRALASSEYDVFSEDLPDRF